jgi:hypothetical protein
MYYEFDEDAPRKKAKEGRAPYDLTEAGSLRESEAATRAAREAESDDASENLVRGPVDRPGGDRWGENKLGSTTSGE